MEKERLLELPMASLVEGFKCAKTSLDMTLSQSKDPVHCSNGKNMEKMEFTRSGSTCTWLIKV